MNAFQPLMISSGYLAHVQIDFRVNGHLIFLESL